MYFVKYPERKHSMRQFMKPAPVRRVGALPRPTPLALAISALLAPALALSAPTGGVVTSGTASINQSGAVTNINQSTQKASINWQGFSIGSNETVNFNQPNSSALTLNRVVGNEKSVIEGALNANGKVFLINSNGMLFTQGSSINTGGFVGSTLNLTDEDFNAGNYVFKSSGSAGSIINLGTITAKDGGYVALLGNSVSNQGVIIATKGTVALSAGDKITLNFNGDSLLSVSIDEGTLNALVENKQAIYADGGTVILTAKAADELLGAQVNNSGIVQARTVDDLKGNITLYAHGGTTHVDGTLDASAPTGGDGGFIETSGDKVSIGDSALVTTKAASGKSGTWLIDPTNFTISSGGAAKTSSGIGATTLANSLNNGDVVIVTAAAGSEEGDINVNAAVSWTGNTKLMLTAADDININAAMSAKSGSLELNAGNAAGNDININAPITLGGVNSSLVMSYGGDYNIRTKASYSGTTTDEKGKLVAIEDTSGGVYGEISLSGSNASLTVNGQAYTLIHSISDFIAINGKSGYFALAGDLDASNVTYTNTVIDSLNGVFAGLGHVIDGVTITIPTANYWDYSNTGVIGTINAGAVVRDLGVTHVDITGYSTIGALAGSNAGTVSKVYATGTVRGNFSVGGLIGSNGFWLFDADDNATLQTGLITGSFSSVTLQGGNSDYGYSSFGGLAARNMRDSVISDSHASGTIEIQQPDVNQSVMGVGGLVATNWGSITSSYASGDITTSAQGDSVGGLLGTNYGMLSNVFATGDVTIVGAATSFSVKAGGLVGQNYNGSISNAYATGDVTVVGTTGYYSSIGGLVGSNTDGSISNVFATGDVSGSVASAGGLVGSNTGSITNASASGDVSSTFIGATIGGLVGSNSQHGSVINGTATGNVFGSNIDVKAGGLVGSNDGLVSGGYASGDIQITGLNSYAGGLVGFNLGTIQDSSANGAIDPGPGTSNGLVGTNEWLSNGVPISGSITNSSYVDVAALAAAHQAAGTQSATSEVAQAMKPHAPASLPGQSDAFHSPAGSLDQNIVFADARSFSTDIRRIEVDGKTFILDEEGDGKGKSPAAPVR
jgi:filamentous hemagglutinin family protein